MVAAKSDIFIIETEGRKRYNEVACFCPHLWR